MKKTAIFCLALALAAAPSAFARALVTAGSSEIGMSGMMDFASEVGTKSELDLRYAYFFIDRLSFGVQGGFSDNDYYTNIRLGIVAEYNFPLSENYEAVIGTDLVPFIGFGAGGQYADSDADDHFAGVLSGEGGVKFFLSDDCAVTFSLLGQCASDDIFMNDKKSSTADLSLRLGMRFYF